MQRFVLSTIAAAVCATLASAANAALLVTIDTSSAAPGQTVTIPVRITSDAGTSPLVNAYSVGITATAGTFGASSDTSSVTGLPQFLGTANFFDSGDVGDPPQGLEASVINNLTDSTAGESVDAAQTKGLFLATFTVPTSAHRGDVISLAVDQNFTSFSSPIDSTGSSTLLPFNVAGAILTVTPEPASLGLICLAGAWLTHRRRR